MQPCNHLSFFKTLIGQVMWHHHMFGVRRDGTDSFMHYLKRAVPFYTGGGVHGGGGGGGGGGTKGGEGVSMHFPLSFPTFAYVDLSLNSYSA